MAVKTSWSAGDVLAAADLTDTFAAKLGTLSVNAQTGTTYTLTTSDPQKVVTMTNAAASTVTIPTNSTAAISTGSAIQIVNLSTGVNTTVSAAGGVTFNGGPVVLSPGSSVTLVKIGTDAWMAQGQGSPGLVHIATSTFSAVSSVSVNNCFTSSYENYLVLATFAASGNAQNFSIRLRASGSDSTAATYNLQYMDVSDTSLSGGRQTSQTAFNIVGIADDDDDANAQELLILRPQVANRTMLLGRALGPNSGSYMRQAAGYFDNTTVFDGLTAFPVSGTITGTLRIYAYRS